MSILLLASDMAAAAKSSIKMVATMRVRDTRKIQFFLKSDNDLVRIFLIDGLFFMFLIVARIVFA